MQWDQSHLAGRVTTSGIAEAARKYVPKLRAGVDFVVALCHSGISRRASPEPAEENAALALARVPGIDAMFLGHQHLLLPGADFAGVGGRQPSPRARFMALPPFMPGFWGGHLGLIDLELDRNALGWRVAAAKVEARAIYARNNRVVTPLAVAEPKVLAAARQGQ